MKLLDKNYPYPILIEGSNDYIESKFDLFIIDGPKEEADHIVLEVEYNLESNGLKNMIELGSAKVVIQASCNETSYRKCFVFKDKTLFIEIPKQYLGTKIEFSSYIVSTCDDNNFILPEHNNVFFDTPTSIRKGDRLAIGDIISFKLEFYDPLRPIASVVKIKENQSKKCEPINIDLTNDKIVIYLNKELFDKYKQLRQYPDLRLYLSTNIVMPAIIEALAEMKNNYYGEQDKRWEMSIQKLLNSMKIDLQNTDLSLYSIANKIFKNGLYTSMKSLEKFYNIEETENED